MELNFLRLFRSTSLNPLLGGRYKIISELGSGGFGHTFLAKDVHLPNHPYCVIKHLKPYVHTPEELQTARRLFNTEAQALYQLGHHDQIPRLLAHFEQNREFYLAQEFIEGKPLTQSLQLGRPWPEADVIALLQDILAILACVHQQNVIHRDIKPANLIRRQLDGRIVLIDFGAVKQATTVLINAQTGGLKTIAIGTEGYMPKEQLGGSPRFSSDVYAVGMLGIQALTGLHPTRLDEDLQTSEIHWRDRTPQVSPELAAILDRMVRYDFRTRYPTATDALTALLPLSKQRQGSQLPGQIASEQPIQVTTQATVTPTQSENTLLTLTPAPLDIEPHIELPSIEQPNIKIPPATAAAIPFLPTTVKNPEPSALITQSRSAQKTAISGLKLPSTLTQRQYLRPWPVSAVLVAIGTTFLLTKAFFVPHSTGQASFSSKVSGDRQVTSAAMPPTVLLLPSLPTTNPATSSPSPKQPAATASLSLSDRPLDPQSTKRLNRAEQLLASAQYQAALNLYNQVITAHPESLVALQGRCYTLSHLRQIEAAIATCDQVLKHQPHDAQALWSKGYVFHSQQQYQAALELYNQAIKLKPDLTQAWNYKGATLLSLDRPDEAIAAFNQAVVLDPHLAELWHNRGVTLLSLGHFEQAIASIDKAIKIQPDYQAALNLRQQLKRKLGR
ncbi:MAG: tetratricopeptide repeat protein [Cyanothece sp. SIO1E1]|nr:tetratricopeptide repeat protein [Cyanothece sp. SIO1E1]